MKSARLLIDQPLPAARNMAIDEALLESANIEGLTTLRFYQWAAPSLSLGYFQKHAERYTHAPSRNIDMVRRSTGGGAIVHHHEWTYSFTTPIVDRTSRHVEQLFWTFHETLVGMLAGAGLTANIYEPAADQNAPPAAEPFLCFLRRARGDILLDGHKIVGSAQRRRQRAVLQHGGILLKKSPHAPELLGIFDLAGDVLAPSVSVDHNTLIDWSSLLGRRLGFDFSTGNISVDEQQRADHIEAEKFTADAWTLRR